MRPPIKNDPAPAGRRPKSSVQVSIARRLRKCMPPQEVQIWLRLRRLRPQGIHFRRQVPIDAFVVDFACLKYRVIVELDGSQHGTEEHQARDRKRDEILNRLGFHVLRFWNHDLREDIDSVMETILSALKAPVDREF